MKNSKFGPLAGGYRPPARGIKFLLLFGYYLNKVRNFF
jgi:hypothetical protein